MQRRIEPTFGNINQHIDPLVVEQERAAAKSRRFWREVRAWSVLGLIFVAFGVGCTWFAKTKGWLVVPDQIDGESLPARALIVGGMLTIFASHLIGACILFAKNPGAATINLFVPGYYLFARKRGDPVWPLMGALVCGLLMTTIGTLMLA